jgi:ATP-dependent RNA helicase DeaD
MPTTFITKHTLTALGFTKLTPMQEQTLQASKVHDHLQLLAPTGSGKTFAFLLPLYHFLLENKLEETAVQAIVIAPTRELVLQIAAVWKNMNTKLVAIPCYGGHKLTTEINEVQNAKPQVIFATPGRLQDHLERATFSVEQVAYFIIDEFDKTLEQGFEESLAFIVSHLKNVSKRMLTSATQAITLPAFMQGQWEALSFLPTAEEEKANIQIFSIESPEADKIKTVIELLHTFEDQSSIVFVNHRDAALRIHTQLALSQIESVFYHGGLEQQARTLALTQFKNKTSYVLIASDIAARGIDVPLVNNIIHYHMPESQEAYTHRNGRTARQGASGTVYILHSEQDALLDYMLEEATPFTIPISTTQAAVPPCITLEVNAGKKNKVSKVDIVGFLCKEAFLKKEEIGLIQVLDLATYVAVPKAIWKDILVNIRGKKLKGKGFIFKVAR